MKLKFLWTGAFTGITATLLFIIIAAFTLPAGKQKASGSRRLADFSKTMAGAGIIYNQPAGFRDAGAFARNDVNFDYGLTLPGHDFEIWFQVTPLKQSWLSYQRAKAIDKQQTINPDSAYLKAGKFKAESISADGTYFERDMGPDNLADYHADAGKTYLVELSDSPATHHFSYALIIMLQKNHSGNLMLMCLTNSKDTDFFRNINRLKNYIRFK